jgi:regulator of replication initiation timing
VSEEEEENGEEEDVDETEELDLEAVIRELEQEIAEADGEAVSEDDETVDDETVSENDEIVVEEDDDEEDDDKKDVDEQSSSSGIGKGSGVKQASASDEEDPGKGKVHEQVDNLQSELNEYKEAVTYLRDKLHEVNILNAKLLYTNRLFREFALSNDQKLKIVETFDRAQTTREIKLVYSTLAESYSDGEAVTKKTSVKESASRKTGTTAPKRKIITEEDQVANRFKKLAGILKD